MKILHVVAGAPTGGAETFCLDAITSLHQSGLEQYVLCRPHPRVVERLANLDIPYDGLSFNRILKPIQSAFIKKTASTTKVDLIHAWMNRASSFIPSGLDVPVLGWFGGYYDLKNYKNCDFYMGVTRDIVRHIIKSTHKPHRTYLCHTFGTLSKDDSPLTREDLGLPAEGRVVLLLSRMHWKKGIDTLLEALQQLEPNTYCILAGDGPELQKYKALAKKLGVEGRTRFLGWRNDRQALLALADACVLPSRYEPFGTVIAEAWFAGVPLVATKADGARQYVKHRVNGLLCEIDDSIGLANSLQEALNNEPLREQVIQGGFEEYRKLFSREVVTEELMSAYSEMIRIYEAGNQLLRDENFSLLEGEAAYLSGKLASKLGNAIDQETQKKALMVAKCYLSEKHDISLAEDVAYIQAKGLFNFAREAENGITIKKLTNQEINRILLNDKIINSINY